MQHKAIIVKSTTYRWIKKSLTFLTILLLTLFAGAPGVLRLVYRADAQVALGHAKSVRMAIQITGTEQNSTAKEKVSVMPPRRVAFRKLFIRRFLT